MNKTYINKYYMDFTAHDLFFILTLTSGQYNKLVALCI